MKLAIPTRKSRKAVVVVEAPVVDKPGGKNRPTPKRSEARSSRPVTPYLKTTGGSRKANSKSNREDRRSVLTRQRMAMKGEGDLSLIPAKDRQPENVFAREFVDNRRNLTTLIIVSYVLVFINFLTGGNSLLLSLTLAIFFLAFVDAFVLAFAVQRAVRKEFPGTTVKVRIYAIQRAVLPRRFRLPRPGVGVKRRPGAPAVTTGPSLRMPWSRKG